MKYATTAFFALLVATPALADGINCAAFRHNQDGSWSPLAPVTITNPNGGQVSIGPGVSFRRGVAFSGIDLAATLDQACSQ